MIGGCKDDVVGNAIPARLECVHLFEARTLNNLWAYSSL